MLCLNLEQIKEYWKNNTQIDWHDQFEREAWKDGLGPLTITDVSEINWNSVVKPTDCDDVEYENIRCGFVRYICSNPNCRYCTDKNLILKGHFKIVRPNGFDPYGKVVYTETKKKTLMKVVDQPVFKPISIGE